MSSSGDSLAQFVRNQLRKTRSSLLLDKVSGHRETDWLDVPVEYRPVQRKRGRELLSSSANERPLRPRTTSPHVRHHQIMSWNGSNVQAHGFAEQRRRSIDIDWESYTNLETRDMDRQTQRTRVNIANALPPTALESPPAYEEVAHEARVCGGPQRQTSTTIYRAYHPEESQTSIAMSVLTTPPTPISPMNTLDYQYLNLGVRRGGTYSFSTGDADRFSNRLT
jgi:hypothetical protein